MRSLALVAGLLVVAFIVARRQPSSDQRLKIKLRSGFRSR
jgi:hypothetical protein